MTEGSANNKEQTHNDQPEPKNKGVRCNEKEQT